MGISTGDLAGYAQEVALYLVTLVAGLVSSAFGVFVMLFFVFYISAGMPSLRTWLARRMNPGMQVPFLAAWDLTKIKVGGYIAARIVLASINSVCSGIVFALIGLPVLAAPRPVDRAGRPVRPEHRHLHLDRAAGARRA